MFALPLSLPTPHSRLGPFKGPNLAPVYIKIRPHLRPIVGLIRDHVPHSYICPTLGSRAPYLVPYWDQYMGRICMGPNVGIAHGGRFSNINPFMCAKCIATCVKCACWAIFCNRGTRGRRWRTETGGGSESAYLCMMLGLKGKHERISRGNCSAA
jgi:hypothetical protein